ncbi:MAG: methyltransferase family protein [Geminicoccales bacterium]
MTQAAHIIYGLLWISFGLLHSMLADQRLKNAAAHVTGSRYRLVYNLIAIVHFALVYMIGRLWLAADAVEFSWSPAWQMASLGLQLLGLGVLVAALMRYDLGLFSGLAQAKERSAGIHHATDNEPLQTAGLHRLVRHPLYLGLFLIIWARVTNEFALATAIWASIYIVIGTKLEEGRLFAKYGEEYSAYKSKVPMYLPWKIFRS